MTFSNKPFGKIGYLFAFLWVAALVVDAKPKVETPKKTTEKRASKPVVAVGMPFLLRTPTLMPKPLLPLSLDPIRFTLQANKDVITEGEEVEITITAQLLDIPASSFFIFEEQKSFSIKLIIPQGFTQTGGDYQDYIGAQLSPQNNTFTKRIRGVFSNIPENPCFVLLRGGYQANANSIFEQKQVLCLPHQNTHRATRMADCASPWIAVQNKQCGTNTYTLQLIVSQNAVLTTNVGQISGTAPNYVINNVPNNSELILTASNCNKLINITLPVAACQSCAPPTIVVGASNCYSTTYSFGVDMFDGVSLTSNYGTVVGNAPHYAVNGIPLGQSTTLTATSATGCESKVIVSSSVCGSTNGGNCTAPILTPITPQTICYGGAFYMVSTNITNGVEAYYQWYNDNGPANNNTNPIANEQRANLRSFPTAPGVYKYKIVATSSAGASCIASQSVTLTVNPPPTITSTTSTDPNCAPAYGGTISVVGAGGTALLYSKDDGGTWVDLTGLNAQDEITRNTMLYAAQKDVARVKITLEAGFGLGPGGEYTGEIRNQLTTPVFEGLAAGTYKIRVKNENGCISEPTLVTLTNPNAPAIFSVTGGGACLANGAPIGLSGSSVGLNYTLYKNGIAVTGAVPGIGGALNFGNHSAEGTYTVMATNATTQCSTQMANSAVISSTPPVAPIIDTETTVICAGQAVALSANATCAGTLMWTPSGGTLTNNNRTYSVAPTSTTIYSAKCQINSCISDVSNSIQLSISPLASPTITGVLPRTLCPDSTTTIIATGCPSAVAWSYTLPTGATGTLTSTDNTLHLTYANSGISAWNAGDTVAVRAACITPACSSQLSEAVKVVKKASCTTSNALADCAFYIKAADAQGTETTKLTRTGAGGSTFQPLTLSAQTLEATSPTGVTYSWTGPGITTPLTTAQISATQVGEYKLTLSSPTGGGQVGVCELYITLSGTPCTIPTSAACGIPANITPSDQGGPYLASLAPGDQFTANDYVITVTSVTITPIGGGGASFSGEGYARMKLTNGFSIDVPVVFGQANGSGTTTTVTPIKLNTCYQLVEGTVVTQYDPSWGNVVDVDKEIIQTIESLEMAFAELKSLREVYTGSEEDLAKIKEIRERIEAEKENLQINDEISETDKQQSLANYNLAISQLILIEQNPTICANLPDENTQPNSQQRNMRKATGETCPLETAIAAGDEANQSIKSKNRQCSPTKRYPGSLIGTILYGNNNGVFTEGDISNDKAYIKNFSEGALAHLLIETYYKTVIGAGQEIELEYSIPRPTPLKNSGFADIVNKTTGEIFEIKSIDGETKGKLEALQYVEWGTLYCPNTPAWHMGTTFPSEVRIPWPVDPLKTDLVVTKPQSGVITYALEDVSRQQLIPTIVPNSKRKDVENLLTQIMQEVVQSPIVLTPLKLNQLILNKFRALTPNELKLALAGILVGTTAYFILNGVVSVGSGGTSVVAQIPLYAAGIAVTAICLKIIDDNYQINTNDNYYN